MQKQEEKKEDVKVIDAEDIKRRNIKKQRKNIKTEKKL